jgi:hypothetical protein
MFEKIGRLAERAATGVSVSRRGFLGRLGQGALAVTGVLGGLLAIRTDARAAGSYVCCKWWCPGIYGRYNSHLCIPASKSCAAYANTLFAGCTFHSQNSVHSCTKC